MRLSIFAKYCLIAILPFLLALSVKGQDYVPDYTQQRAFACIILDKTTGQPLDKATLRVGKYGWSADEAGRVESFANIGDTLVFTHVGYFPVILEVHDSLFAQSIVAVSLSQDTVALSEIVVKPRRLSLSEAVKRISIEESKHNAMAFQSFASGTHEALSAPKSWGQWSSTDNQMNALGKYNRQIEYKGMLPPEQSINITNIALSAIVAIVNKIAPRPRNSAVTPLSESEIHLILSQEESSDPQ